MAPLPSNDEEARKQRETIERHERLLESITDAQDQFYLDQDDTNKKLELHEGTMHELNDGLGEVGRQTQVQDAWLEHLKAYHTCQHDDDTDCNMNKIHLPILGLRGYRRKLPFKRPSKEPKPVEDPNDRIARLRKEAEARRPARRRPLPPPPPKKTQSTQPGQILVNTRTENQPANPPPSEHVAAVNAPPVDAPDESNNNNKKSDEPPKDQSNTKSRPSRIILAGPGQISDEEYQKLAPKFDSNPPSDNGSDNSSDDPGDKRNSGNRGTILAGPGQMSEQEYQRLAADLSKLQDVSREHGKDITRHEVHLEHHKEKLTGIDHLNDEFTDVNGVLVGHTAMLGHHDDRLDDLSTQQREIEKDMRRLEAHEKKLSSISHKLEGIHTNHADAHHRIGHVEDKVGRLEHKTRVHDDMISLQQLEHEETTKSLLVAGLAGIAVATLSAGGSLWLWLKAQSNARRRERELREENQRLREANLNSSKGNNVNGNTNEGQTAGRPQRRSVRQARQWQNA